MRAVCLCLALILSAPAALAAEPTFIEQLAAGGPRTLRVAEGLGPVLPDARALVAVEDGVMVIEIQRGKAAPAEVFRYDGKGFKHKEVWSEAAPAFDLDGYCKGGGTAERYEIQCFSRMALQSRALRPPDTIWTLRLSADGLRVVKDGFGPRVTMTPLMPARKGAAWPEPGVAANLGDALSQLAAHEKGGLGGGSSGGGDWYASDLWVREVRGLDFTLERTTWPDRGGRSDQVPATWSFDYQGPAGRDATVLTWRMIRTRKGAKESGFWCVSKPVSTVVEVACHRGGRPSDVKRKPDVAFKLEPFPKWKIHVEAGPDNPFNSVGTSRLEPLPFP